MNTLSEIQEYFETLCTKHKELLHGTDGRVSFGSFKADDISNQLTGKANSNAVIISAINGQRIGDIDDGQIRRGVSLMFISSASTDGSLSDAITAANEKAEEIMFDFISRMQFDETEGCELNFDLQNLSWDDIEGPWLENYYGWLLFIPFKGYLTPYNAENWND